MSRADRRSARSARSHAHEARQRSRSARGDDVLHAAAPAREVDVRLPRARLRGRLRRLRDRRQPECVARRPHSRQQRLHERQPLGRRRARAAAEEPEERRRPSASSRPRCRRTARPNEAITVLNSYVTQRPKDEDALRELAGLYLARANALAQDAQIAQLRRQLSHLRLDVRRPARPRQRRHDRHRPDRRRDLDAGLAGGQRRRTGRRRPPTRARSPRTRSWWRSPHAIRTSSWSSRRPRSRAGTRPRRSRPTSGSSTLAPDDPSAPIVKQQIAQLKAAQTPATSG